MIVTDLSDRERKRFFEACKGIAVFAAELGNNLASGDDTAAQESLVSLGVLGTTVCAELDKVFKEAVTVPVIPDNIAEILGGDK